MLRSSRRVRDPPYGLFVASWHPPTGYSGDSWVVSNTGGPNGHDTYASCEDWNSKNNTISSVQLAT